MRNAPLLVLLLAGCATSPAEVRESGLRSEAVSTRAPLEAATCIVRNVEAMSFDLGTFRAPANIRPAPDGGYEVVVLGPTQWTIAVAEVRPRTGGSAITTWLNTRQALIGAGQLEHMAKGC